MNGSNCKITNCSLSDRNDAGALMVPLTAAQILWINLLTDGLPALVLAFDRTPGVMQQPPRRANSPLLDRPSANLEMASAKAHASSAPAERSPRTPCGLFPRGEPAPNGHPQAIEGSAKMPAGCSR